MLGQRRIGPASGSYPLPPSVATTPPDDPEPPLVPPLEVATAAPVELPPVPTPEVAPLPLPPELGPIPPPDADEDADAEDEAPTPSPPPTLPPERRQLWQLPPGVPEMPTTVEAGWKQPAAANAIAKGQRPRRIDVFKASSISQRPGESSRRTPPCQASDRL
jgi:hypothetical protein